MNANAKDGQESSVKIDACVHTITRDSRFLEASLRSVLPYVTRALVLVDDRSMPSVREKVEDLQKEFPNLFWDTYHVVNPFEDLVKMRNIQLACTTEPWVWIVDDDEYYPRNIVNSLSYCLKDADAYALQFWPIWDKERHHVATTRAFAPRIFRNKGKLEWVGKFGRERLTIGGAIPKPVELSLRYIHFTHVKKSVWREELGKQREADDRRLGKTPEHIIKEIEHLL